MDLSPVYQAVPVLGGCVAVLVLGLLLGGRPGRIAAQLAGLAIVLVFAGAGTYIGLGLACQAWAERPEYAWITLGVVIGAIALFAQHQAAKHRDHDDDDEDDEGGQHVYVPVPDPPPTNWSEFDDLRRGWDREPAGV